MGLFKNNNKLTDKNNSDRNLIEMNSKSIETLIVLCEDEEFKNELKKVEENLKFLIPSTKDKVYDFDKKIKGAVEDLKIYLTKNPIPDTKGKSLLKELKILITERNAYL